MQMRRARRSYRAPVEAQVGKVWSRGSVAWRETGSVVEAGRRETVVGVGGINKYRC